MQPPSHVQRSLLAEEALRAVVLTYLAEHTEAMDTIEGIAEWWVTRQQIRVDVERLAYVLERLTDEGVLEAVGEGTHRLYRLSAAYLSDESGPSTEELAS